MSIENIYRISFKSRLIAAREMAGYSMQELGDKAGLSKQAISKFENGILSPSSDAVIRLANAMNLSEDYFFKEEGAEPNITLASISLREKKKLILNEFEIIKKDTVDYIMREIELEKIADNKLYFKNPIADLSIKSQKDAEKAAKQLRKKWNLGNVQIPNVVDLLENKGIKVYEVERSENFEGFAAWAGTIPVIVINKAIKEVTRIRFTTLHELGHLVLQFIENLDEKTIERLCDTFSGELLFPTEAVIIEFGGKRTKISIEELKNIKEKYGFSISAIILSALKSNIIDSETYDDWKRNYNQWYNEKRDFGKYSGSEKPQRFNKLLYTCLIEGRISLGKASVLAKINEGELKKHFHSLERYNIN